MNHFLLKQATNEAHRSHRSKPDKGFAVMPFVTRALQRLQDGT